MKPRGGAILTFAVHDDSVGELKKFRARNKVSYPIVLDKGDKTISQFGVGIPTAVLIDRKHIIRHVQEGFDPESFASDRKKFLSFLRAKR